MFANISDTNDLEVFVEKNDLCHSCKNMYKCPLLTAILKEQVIMHYEFMEIKKCDMYRRENAQN